MDISIRKANKGDYESSLSLFRQVHELHVCERPDLYRKNSTPISEEFFESQLNDIKQHIFVATIGNEIVGVVGMKEEEIIENSFVKGIIYKQFMRCSSTEKEGDRKKAYEICF
jgi:hypothetical protein